MTTTGKQGKKTRKSSRVSVTARLRAQDAVRLRVAGMTHENIAKQLGYSNASASYKAVIRELNATAQDQSESNDSLRILELKRLDQYLQSVTPQAVRGDIAAVNTAIRIGESRRNLLGLDAPKQIEARIKVDIISWNEALRDMLQIYKEIHGINPLANEFVGRLDSFAQTKFVDAVG